MRASDFAAAGVEAYIGDALELLRELPDDSIDCVVTSPPYWNLRDYGVDGQQGLEATPNAYIDAMVVVFREVRRVLAPAGTMFLNIGDSYCASRSGPIGDLSGLDGGQSAQKASRMALNGVRAKDKPNRRQAYPELGIKNKDLVGIPWRLAFALQLDGWRLRQDIIWSKPNPMPESVKDRPTKAHEYVFLMTKSERYFWDGDAIAEPVSENTHLRLAQNVAAQIGSLRANGGTRPDRPMKPVRGARFPTGWAHGTGRRHDELTGRYAHRKLAKHGSGIKSNESMNAALALPNTHRRKPDGRLPGAPGMPPQIELHPEAYSDMRNARSVWSILTEGYSGAHYATFPRELARRCILAGTPADGVVLDPFVGSGTTLAVCVTLDRRGIGFDLDRDSLRLIERRVGEAVLERSRLLEGTLVAIEVSDLGPLWEPRAT